MIVWRIILITCCWCGAVCLDDWPLSTNASQFENIETFQLTKIKLTFWTQSPNSSSVRNVSNYGQDRDAKRTSGHKYKFHIYCITERNYIFTVGLRSTRIVTEKFCLIWMGKLAFSEFLTIIIIIMQLDYFHSVIVRLQWSNTRTHWMVAVQFDQLLYPLLCEVQHCKKHIRRHSLHLYKSWMV